MCKPCCYHSHLEGLQCSRIFGHKVVLDISLSQQVTLRRVVPRSSWEKIKAFPVQHLFSFNSPQCKKLVSLLHLFCVQTDLWWFVWRQSSWGWTQIWKFGTNHSRTYHPQALAPHSKHVADASSHFPWSGTWQSESFSSKSADPSPRD